MAGQRGPWVAATSTSRVHRPNLFVIGSMKSGTTYLSAMLGSHPAIFMSSPREPCYFVDPRALRRAWPRMWEKGFWQSADRYLDLFAGARDATVIAESSNFYSQDPLFAGVPERILSFSPDARFIYIMRDPVERTISHYWHHVSWLGERRPLLTALRSDPLYTDVSHYARQLSAYLAHVEPRRVYALTLEALAADPIGQLRLMYAWLGVDPSFRPPDLNVPANVRPRTFRRARGHGVLDRMRRTSRSYWTIAPFLPAALRQLGWKLAVRDVTADEAPLAEAHTLLRSRQRPQTEELGRLLNRTFPEWKTLFGAS